MAPRRDGIGGAVGAGVGDGESVGELVAAGVAGSVVPETGEALRLGATATTEAEADRRRAGPALERRSQSNRDSQ